MTDLVNVTHGAGPTWSMIAARAGRLNRSPTPPTLAKSAGPSGNIDQSEAKRSKAMQTGAERSKAKLSEAKRSNAKQSDAKRSKAKQSEAKPSNAKQNEAKRS